MLGPTNGITEPMLTLDPLGTEGEMSPGPDEQNPFDDEGTDGRRDVPLGGDDVVDTAVEAAGERHERAMDVFAYSPGRMGALDPEVQTDREDIFRW